MRWEARGDLCGRFEEPEEPKKKKRSFFGRKKKKVRTETNRRCFSMSLHCDQAKDTGSAAGSDAGSTKPEKTKKVKVVKELSQMIHLRGVHFNSFAASEGSVLNVACLYSHHERDRGTCV